MSNNMELERHISSVFAFAKAGNKKMALNMLDMLDIAFATEKAFLDEVRTKVLLNQGLSEEITLPYEREMEQSETFSRNCAVLKKYNLCFGKLPGQLSWFVVFSSNELIIAQNRSTKEIKLFRLPNIEYDEQRFTDRPVFAEKVLLRDQMRKMSNVVVKRAVCAIYLGESENELEILLQLSDLSDLIAMKVFVFMIGKDGVKECFSDNFFPFPSLHFSMTGEELEYDFVLREMQEKKSKELERNLQLVNEYYGGGKKERDERIRSGHPRIMFWSCIDSYIIPHQTRDECESARRLGCECLVMEEPDFVRRITKRKFVELLAEFKPDVIFEMNRFRYENNISIPEDIVYVTWIQDPWPNILNPFSREKLLKRDILLNHLVNYRDICDLYGDFLVDAPIPASSYIYKPYEVSEEEQERYGSDICLVCMCSETDHYLEELFKSYENKACSGLFVEIVKEIFFEYKSLTEHETFFYTKAEFIEFVGEKFRESGVYIESEVTISIAEEMEKGFNQRLFRQALVDWLIDAGFQNIKLWGYGWKAIPKYEKYAMGPAKNGEELSKIFQASKIVLGNNVMTTAAARAWECMLSGGFYLSNYIPPEADICDIKNYIPEGSFDMFRTREELIDKISFYLENEKARCLLVEKGREAALKTMTYDVLMKKLIDIMPQYL